MLQERCGSLPYVAPEVTTQFIANLNKTDQLAIIKLNGSQPYHAEPIDVWGCGVILFTLLVGSEYIALPFLHSSDYLGC